MFEVEKYITIGKIARTHGYDGSIKIAFHYPIESFSTNFKFLFISIHQKPVPFCVLNKKSVDNDIIVFKLEDVDDKESAQGLVGKEVFLKRELVEINPIQDVTFFIGFRVFDQHQNEFGVIDDIFDNSGHYLFHTNYGEDTLIPFHEDLILEIDENNKSITLEIPDGLIEE